MWVQVQSFLSVLFLVVPIFSQGQKPVPDLWGQRVHDEAHTLRHETIENLEGILSDHEKATSNQIAILIIPSLDGEVLEEYSLKVAEQWKLGQADKDNGVLVLIAIDDHKMRIEVGQGLEGALTDAQSSRIIRNEMAPSFRRGDYDAGVKAGVDAIIKAIGGEYAGDNSSDADGQEPEFALERPLVTGWTAFWVGLFIFGFLLMFALPALLVNHGAAWLMYGLWIFFHWVVMLVLGLQWTIISFVFLLIFLPLGRWLLSRTPWGRNLQARYTRMMNKWASSGNSGSGGSWSSRSSYSSNSSSSGSSRSSFSGGGGTFGGGGSSGSW